MNQIEQQIELMKLFAEKFIARPDVKAFQQSDGSYRPDRSRIVKNDLLQHLNGQVSMGHYLVNTDNTVKLFAFDIDLEKTGMLPSVKSEEGIFSNFQPGDPREFWRSRKRGPARDILRYQMRMLSHGLVSAIQQELDIPAVCAYSGSKGMHVYGLTGPTSADLARKGAAIVLESTGKWKLNRGRNFYKYSDSEAHPEDHELQFQQFSLEVYPKQDSLDNKDLGNLMRLPLGKNLRSPNDPTMFVDMRCAMTEMVERNPIEALTATNAFA